MPSDVCLVLPPTGLKAIKLNNGLQSILSDFLPVRQPNVQQPGVPSRADEPPRNPQRHDPGLFRSGMHSDWPSDPIPLQLLGEAKNSIWANRADCSRLLLLRWRHGVCRRGAEADLQHETLLRSTEGLPGLGGWPITQRHQRVGADTRLFCPGGRRDLRICDGQ